MSKKGAEHYLSLSLSPVDRSSDMWSIFAIGKHLNYDKDFQFFYARANLCLGVTYIRN